MTQQMLGILLIGFSMIGFGATIYNFYATHKKDEEVALRVAEELAEIRRRRAALGLPGVRPGATMRATGRTLQPIAAYKREHAEPTVGDR